MFKKVLTIKNVIIFCGWQFKPQKPMRILYVTALPQLNKSFPCTSTWLINIVYICINLRIHVKLLRTEVDKYSCSLSKIVYLLYPREPLLVFAQYDTQQSNTFSSIQFINVIRFVITLYFLLTDTHWLVYEGFFSTETD